MEKKIFDTKKPAAVLAAVGALVLSGCYEETTYNTVKRGVYEEGVFYYPSKSDGSRFEAMCDGDALLSRTILGGGRSDSSDTFLNNPACSDGEISASDNLLPLAQLALDRK